MLRIETGASHMLASAVLNYITAKISLFIINTSTMSYSAKNSSNILNMDNKDTIPLTYSCFLLLLF
jgi:ABC-type uncharacterized transport system permease subunit